MPPTTMVEATRMEEVLLDAVEDKSLAVLTHQSPAGWRLFKCCFRAGSRSSQTIMLEAQLPVELTGAALPRVGTSLGVTFRSGHKKFLFLSTASSIERYGERAVVTMRWPDTLQQLQRRVFERVEPPRNAAIAVRLWAAEGSESSPVEQRAVRHGQLENLSAGGMQVKVSDAAEFSPGGAFRCIFTPRRGRPSIMVDAVVRHREAGDSGRASIGFQFVGLEATPEGHQTLERLARMVSDFQRAHSRRRRHAGE